MRLNLARIGDVLQLGRREVVIDPTRDYKVYGLRSFGKGVFDRGSVLGADLGSFRFFELRNGDLVVSNIKAWEGAVAVASKEDVGKVGNHRFLTYVPRGDTVDVRYLKYFFLSEVGLALIQRASPGSADRNRTLSQERFERIEVPLPTIDEQRRLANRLDGLFVGLVKARVLRAESSGYMEALLPSAAHRPDLDESQKRRRGWQRLELGLFLRAAAEEVSVDPQRSYPNLGILSFGRGVFEKPPIDGSATSASRLFRVRAGQFIYSRLFAFEGAYATVPERFDDYFVSNEFPAFEVDRSCADPMFLSAYFRLPTLWAELARGSKGLGDRRQRVHPDRLLSFQVWVPPIDDQRAVSRAVGLLERGTELRARAHTLSAAVEPSVLNQAFSNLM